MEKALKKYGETHIVEKIWGTEPDLRNLKKNQSVCWGDGETYHILLTEKESKQDQQIQNK